MSRNSRNGWIGLIALNVATLCVLGFQQSSPAQSRRPHEPFVDAVEQRVEMINHLKDIAALLREQNALLRSGTVRVIAESAPAQP